MADFQYDYILSFVDGYNEYIIASSDCPDKSSDEFKQFVQERVGELEAVIRLQPGVKDISRYIDFNDSRYCINLSVNN